MAQFVAAGAIGLKLCTYMYVPLALGQMTAQANFSAIWFLDWSIGDKTEKIQIRITSELMAGSSPNKLYHK
jgi:hypothetical protein